MDSKFKGRIISALRKLTWSWTPRNEAEAAQKVAPATFECESCGVWIYTGKKSLDKLELDPPKGLIKGTKYLDHIDPVVKLSEDHFSWDTYISQMFSPRDNFQVLCKPCHDVKTKKENKQRKIYKDKKSNK